MLPATILLAARSPVPVTQVPYAPPASVHAVFTNPVGPVTSSGGDVTLAANVSMVLRAPVVQVPSGSFTPDAASFTNVVTNSINAVNVASDTITMTSKNVIVNADMQVRGTLETINATELKVNDKTITLGVLDANDDGLTDADDRTRDRAGVVVAGAPQHLPPGKDPDMYEHSLRWHRERGDFSSDGAPVAPHDKPLWSFSGGGVGISAPDHMDRKAQFFFAPYFTPVSASLGLYYALGDGRVKLVQTFSATPFGSSPTPSIAPQIDTYGKISRPIGLLGNGWSISQMRGGFSMDDDAALFTSAVTSAPWKSISFYVLDSIIPANAGNAEIAKTYWVSREDFTMVQHDAFGHRGLKPVVARALVTDGNHAVSSALIPRVVQNVQHVFNWSSIDPASLLNATMHVKIWLDLVLPVVAFSVPPIPTTSPKWTTDFDIPGSERDVYLTCQLEASSSGMFSKIDGDVPTGLAMDSNGKITGTPSVSGTYHFVIRCSNPDFTAYTDRAFSWCIGDRPIWVTTSMLPVTTVDTPPSFCFEAFGAVRMQVTAGSSFAPGCTIDATMHDDGRTPFPIVGVPSLKGNYVFAVRAYGAIPTLYRDQAFTWNVLR